MEPHTRLPMIYIEDCLSALFQFLNTPDELLRRRVYNVTAMSFTPEELFNELFKYVPDLKITYKPDKRQHIGKYCNLITKKKLLRNNWIKNFVMFCYFVMLILAESWPQVFDDSEARRDWGWQHKYDLQKLVELMVRDVGANFLPKYRLKEVNSYV